MISQFFECFLHTRCFTYQNDANDANAKVNPKLSLNATLSSIADLRSIPFTYRCSLVVGMTLYPCEARYYAKISSASLSPSLFTRQWAPRRHTCTPNTSNPNSMANVFENVLTATPPSKPIHVTSTVSPYSPLPHLNPSSLIHSRHPPPFPTNIQKIKQTKSPPQHTSNTPPADLPKRPRIYPPVPEHRHLGLPLIRPEARRRAGGGGFAQERSRSGERWCRVEAETETETECERG